SLICLLSLSYLYTHYPLYFTLFFFFTATATTDIYTLSLHDALPICEKHFRDSCCFSEREVFGNYYCSVCRHSYIFRICTTVDEPHNWCVFCEISVPCIFNDSGNFYT